MGLVEQLTDIKTRLNTVLEESKTALTDKGVEVPEDATLDDIAGLVAAIESGGGGGAKVAFGEYVSATDVALNSLPPLSLNHNLGVVPDFIILYRLAKNTSTERLISVVIRFKYYLDGSSSDEWGNQTYGGNSASLGSVDSGSYYSPTETMVYFRSNSTAHTVYAGKVYRYIAIALGE